MKADHERVTKLLTDTVTLLCKNGLAYSDELKIQGLLGVTVDKSDIFIVQICETCTPLCRPNREDDSTNPQPSSSSGGGEVTPPTPDGPPPRKKPTPHAASSTNDFVDLTRLAEVPHSRRSTESSNQRHSEQLQHKKRPSALQQQSQSSNRNVFQPPISPNVIKSPHMGSREGHLGREPHMSRDMGGRDTHMGREHHMGGREHHSGNREHQMSSREPHMGSRQPHMGVRDAHGGSREHHMGRDAHAGRAGAAGRRISDPGAASREDAGFGSLTHLNATHEQLMQQQIQQHMQQQLHRQKMSHHQQQQQQAQMHQQQAQLHQHMQHLQEQLHHQQSMHSEQLRQQKMHDRLQQQQLQQQNFLNLQHQQLMQNVRKEERQARQQREQLAHMGNARFQRPDLPPYMMPQHPEGFHGNPMGHAGRQPFPHPGLHHQRISPPPYGKIPRGHSTSPGASMSPFPPRGMPGHEADMLGHAGMMSPGYQQQFQFQYFQQMQNNPEEFARQHEMSGRQPDGLPTLQSFPAPGEMPSPGFDPTNLPQPPQMRRAPRVRPAIFNEKIDLCEEEDRKVGKVFDNRSDSNSVVTSQTITNSSNVNNVNNSSIISSVVASSATNESSNFSINDIISGGVTSSSNANSNIVPSSIGDSSSSINQNFQSTSQEESLSYFPANSNSLATSNCGNTNANCSNVPTQDSTYSGSNTNADLNNSSVLTSLQDSSVIDSNQGEISNQVSSIIIQPDNLDEAAELVNEEGVSRNMVGGEVADEMDDLNLYGDISVMSNIQEILPMDDMCPMSCAPGAAEVEEGEGTENLERSGEIENSGERGEDSAESGGERISEGGVVGNLENQENSAVEDPSGFGQDNGETLEGNTQEALMGNTQDYLFENSSSDARMANIQRNLVGNNIQNDLVKNTQSNLVENAESDMMGNSQMGNNETLLEKSSEFPADYENNEALDSGNGLQDDLGINSELSFESDYTSSIGCDLNEAQNKETAVDGISEHNQRDFPCTEISRQSSVSYGMGIYDADRRTTALLDEIRNLVCTAGGAPNERSSMDCQTLSQLTELLRHKKTSPNDVAVSKTTDVVSAPIVSSMVEPTACGSSYNGDEETAVEGSDAMAHCIVTRNNVEMPVASSMYTDYMAEGYDEAHVSEGSSTTVSNDQSVGVLNQVTASSGPAGISSVNDGKLMGETSAVATTSVQSATTTNSSRLHEPFYDPNSTFAKYTQKGKETGYMENESEYTENETEYTENETEYTKTDYKEDREYTETEYTEENQNESIMDDMGDSQADSSNIMVSQGSSRPACIVTIGASAVEVYQYLDECGDGGMMNEDMEEQDGGVQEQDGGGPEQDGGGPEQDGGVQEQYGGTQEQE